MRSSLSVQVERVVYSTCSIHSIENEGVVAAVLRSLASGGILGEEHEDDATAIATAATSTADHSELDIDPSAASPAHTTHMSDAADAAVAAVVPPAFELAKCLESWPRRGREVEGLSKAQADCLVRALPDQDQTHGFFVACFQRVGTTGPKSAVRASVIDSTSTGTGRKVHAGSGHENDEGYSGKGFNLPARSSSKTSEPPSDKGPKGPDSMTKKESKSRKRRLQQQREQEEEEGAAEEQDEEERGGGAAVNGALLISTSKREADAEDQEDASGTIQPVGASTGASSGESPGANNRRNQRRKAKRRRRLAMRQAAGQEPG